MRSAPEGETEMSEYWTVPLIDASSIDVALRMSLVWTAGIWIATKAPAVSSRRVPKMRAIMLQLRSDMISHKNTK